MKSSSIFHENLQFLRQRFSDIDHLSRDRLDTPQMCRMQCEPIFQFRKLIPIEIIAENRAAHIRQVDANLMGTSGFELEADECASVMYLFNAVMRHGALRAGLSVEKLRELKEGRPVETEILLPVSLVVRNSTAPRRG